MEAQVREAGENQLIKENDSLKSSNNGTKKGNKIQASNRSQICPPIVQYKYKRYLYNRYIHLVIVNSCIH